MKEQLDLVKILKDCPKDMELDCLMYEDVYFDYVDERNIIHCYIQHETHKTSITFNQHGTHNNDIKSKCVIFPKGKTTWEGFTQPCKFKNGDIISDNYFKTICIFKGEGSIKGTVDFYCGIDNSGKHLFIKDIKDQAEHFGEINGYNFATEEEKEKFFQSIKDNGYKWNAETKTLEKLIVPKFKVGDKIRLKENHNYIYTITDIKEKENKYTCGVTFVLRFSEQDNWELMSDKFDPKTLQPFDKVLVKQYNEHWYIQFFETIHEYNKKYPFMCLGGKIYSYCIPYAGNEYLLDTTDEPSEFYKYWEN